MSKRMPRRANRKIDRTAMDALIYGLLRSLDYTEDHGEVILDRMGSLMLQYLIETGTVPSESEETGRSLKALLARNGYGFRVRLLHRPGQTTPSFPNFVKLMAKRPGLRAGSVRSTGALGSKKIDWILYETSLYGMTKALDDQLGAQAQLILKRIGAGILEYLIRVGAVEQSSDSGILLERVIDFFVKAGYTKNFRFELEGVPPDTFVSRYVSAPYFSTVFRRLQKEDSALFSCPLCLVGHHIWGLRGWRFGEVLGVRTLPGNRIVAKARVYPSADRFTEDDAQKFSQMKPSRAA